MESNLKLNKYTANINDKVFLDIGETGLASNQPITIPTLFHNICEKYPNQLALCSTENLTPHITYSEYQKIVYQTAKAFIQIGLKPKNTIGILAFNCPEWFYAELGGILAGGIIAGIYTTNSVDAVQHVLASSNALIAIVENTKQMEMICSIKSKLPKLKAIIQMHGPYNQELMQIDNHLYKWSDIQEMHTTTKADADADAELNIELEKRIGNLVPNECCCLIYTSGTTGAPKAAMLSHDNLTWAASSIVDSLSNMTYGDEVFVSYLPLNHIAAQLIDIFVPITVAGCVYFADQNAFKGTLVKTLNKARPTRFLGVPRVWEKLHEQLLKKENQLNWFMKLLLNASKYTMLNYHEQNIQGLKPNKWKYYLAVLMANNIKMSLGFDRCREFVIGAAPSSKITKEFFLSIDVNIIDVLGMTEACTISLSDVNAPTLNTIGKPMSGVQMKILNPDHTGNGEICIKSRGVFMGYLNELDKTKETFDDDNWLRSGDLGYINVDGYSYITGRLKELIITAGAENIAPVPIESYIKTELPAISNALLVGDAKKYLTILLTFKTETQAETGAPTNLLRLESLEYLKSLNLNYKTITEILDAGPCPVIFKNIQNVIQKYNQIATSNAQKIQKFTILPNDFSMLTGELGPTLKLNRNIIVRKYEDYINAMYAD